MNPIRSACLLLTATFAVSSLSAQPAPAPTPAPMPAPATVPAPAAPRARLSPHETVSTFIGGDHKTGTMVTISYGRPYSKKPGTEVVRQIWGGLVKWDKADRLGADEATLLVTPRPLVIGETTVPAGAYTLYIVASENGASKLAFSSNIAKWGIPVDETHDVARFDLKKDRLEKSVDQLTLALESVAGGGVLKILWETTQYSLPFTVKK